MNQTRPLDGVKVLEMGQLLAGPFASCLLGYFGAEIVKIETPHRGDPIRNWRVVENGTSLWWRSLARNKKCITVNLREQRGRDLAQRLADQSDVLIENFRPGTMEKWGLGPDDLKKTNPNLIYARISGFGQSGPYAHRPGYASVCEGIGGLRYLNGFPGEPPVRMNLSLGDSLAGLHAAFGILLGLLHRHHTQDAAGQVVDVALYESVFNMLESVVPEYDHSDVIREPSGTTLTGIVPTNTYRCADGKHVIIGGNGDSIFQRLMRTVGRPDMADDPKLADNLGRVAHEKPIDDAISTWTNSLDSKQVLSALEEAAVPSGPIYNAADMFGDPQFNARGLFESVEYDGKSLKIPALAPKLTETPGRTDWAGPQIGAHTDEVLESMLGMDKSEIEALRADGIL